MIETNAQAYPVSALSEPVRHDRDRDIRAKWDVGQADRDGWQPQALLLVTYHKGTGYRASLSTVHERRERMFVAEQFQFGTPVLSIYAQPGTRFNRATLGKVYDRALAELRRRYAADDAAVLAYFEPTTAAPATS
jgi:hypothetical protein